MKHSVLILAAILSSALLVCSCTGKGGGAGSNDYRMDQSTTVNKNKRTDVKYTDSTKPTDDGTGMIRTIETDFDFLNTDGLEGLTKDVALDSYSNAEVTVESNLAPTCTDGRIDVGFKLFEVRRVADEDQEFPVSSFEPGKTIYLPEGKYTLQTTVAVTGKCSAMKLNVTATQKFSFH